MVKNLHKTAGLDVGWNVYKSSLTPMWLLVFLAFPGALFAADISWEPLPVMQQNPAMMRYFNPIPTSSHPLALGRTQLRLQGHYTSLFLADQLPKAQRYLADMELFVAQAGLRYGLGYGSDFEVTLPLLRPMAGGMDRFLHRYHRAFGLPNGGRELRPNDQFGYFYQNNGSGWRAQPQWEVGSVQLTLRTKPSQQPWALLVGVRLPTANRSRGWGAGGVDLGLGAVTSWQQGGWFGHGEGWWVHPFVRHGFGSGVRDYLRASATLGHAFTPFSIPMHALIQAQGGASPYRTGVAALDNAPWLISVGLRTVSDDGWQWSATFVENITQASTQDFALSVGVAFPLFE
ncbi:MAG: DUF3187 family protein [Mariprofundales bacterium]